MVYKKITHTIVLLLCVLAVLISSSGQARATPAGSSELMCCPDECGTKQILLRNPAVAGEEIAEIQLALKKLGLYQGKLDGVFGVKTHLAVKAFQKAHKIKETGQIDWHTRLALKKVFETAASGQPQGAPQGEARLEIYIESRTLVVYENDKPYKTFKVAVGKRATPTPIGQWEVTRKAKDWGTGFGTRWMGLNVPWGIFGIHGTNKPWSIGSRASHGCIRMHNHDVEELYKWVKPGTKVSIIGNVFPNRYEDRLILRRGFKGSDVYQVQIKLIEMGYLQGKPDGIYGPASIAAVKKFQKDHNFPVTGEVDIDIYPAIGL